MQGPLENPDLREIIDEYDNLIVFGAGITGVWLFNHLNDHGYGERTLCVIDNDHKKHGTKICDQLTIEDVTYLEGLGNEALSKSLVINTISDIQETWDQGNSFGCAKQIAIGTFIDTDIVQAHTKILDLTDVYGKGNYIAHSLECAMHAHKAYFSKSTIFLRSLDLMVTERCSLKCVDCSNLMQYYTRPKSEDKDELISGLKHFLSKIDHLFELRLIGGEPFVHNEIYSIIDECSSMVNISKISLYTNSTILIREEQFKKFKAGLGKLYFSITDYGDLSYKLQENIDILNRLNIPYRCHAPEFWTDSGRIIYEERTEMELQELFNKCCGKNLFTLSGGRFYRCPFAANLDRLSDELHDKHNYINIDEVTKESMNKYVNDLKYLPACKNCKGRSYDSEQIKPAIQTNKVLDICAIT